ncbi:MAG: DUF3592 domain-containing protein [Bacteroidetes bacterium]|nr:DUF3592 domain-containing protein [Bacteroidota bacterium]
MPEILNIVVLLAVGLALIIGGFNFKRKNNKLIKNGIEVEGVIFSIEFPGDSNIKGVYPVIRFVTNNGLWITETADLALPSFLLKKGTSVKVLYNPDNPKEFVYKTNIDLSMISYLFLSAGLLMLLLATWSVYKYFTK